MADEASADAPGRVNLIGEHTDYHDGFVLPTTIPQRTSVTLRRRTDRRVHAASAGMDAAEPYELGRESRRHHWIDYVQGVTTALAAAGHHIGGFDARITSTIPVGAGVSSSAALEVSVLRGLRTLFRLDFDDVELAKIAQQAETGLVGAPVGIMDQMASSLGHDGEALFLDTRTLAVERVPLPDSIELIVIDSGVPHAHARGEYATRRRESFEAAARLGVARLRDVDVSALQEIAELPPVLARRARHIVTENQRVLDAVEALRQADAPRLGALFAASHASMRDDYQTSTPDVDALVRIGAAHPDVYGARLTGGGFGGAVVMIARRTRAAAAAVAIADAYSRETSRRGTVLVPLVGNGLTL
jgi:galactokinase